MVILTWTATVSGRGTDMSVYCCCYYENDAVLTLYFSSPLMESRHFFCCEQNFVRNTTFIYVHFLLCGSSGGAQVFQK
jgi:hypothetical protein